jgi:outer membrane receptor protein involved in Fe transport
VSPIGGTSSAVLEAPGAEIYGVELETVWLITDSATIGTNLSYTPAITDDLFIADVADYSIPGRCIRTEALTENIKAISCCRSPRAGGHLGGYSSIYEGQHRTVHDLSWIDDVYFTPFQSEDTMADAYDRVDVRATWTTADQNWVVTGFVNNVFDEVGVLHIERTGEAYLWRQLAATTAPRLYGLELTYKFGGYGY